jgi:hypothetical protein
MYPSGAWRGYWEAVGWGRQLMDNLVLRFAAETVSGEGTDVLSPFTFHGSCDAHGNVTLVKQYRGRHRHTVQYVGRYDGEGTIFGRWHIGASSGPFALSPARNQAAADMPILTISAEPPAEKAER